MQLLSVERVKKIEDKQARNLLILIFMCVLFAAIYGFSFTLDNLIISIAIGVAGVTLCLVFYYACVYESAKLVRLFKDIRQGISQEETYTFVNNDIFTEHNGVRLNSINTTYSDAGEIFERTLYFVTVLEYPSLKEGQVFTAHTFRNIIIEININD